MKSIAARRAGRSFHKHRGYLFPGLVISLKKFAVILFPNGKINIGLHVTAKRSDGFHNLESVFYPIPLQDVIEVIEAEDFSFQPSGLSIPGPAQANLCVQAYAQLKTDFPSLPPVHMYLYKHIPMGAGLGGGSADGAFMIRLLDQCFHLQLSKEKLLAYALALGSDCPYFLLNEPAFVSLRGESVEPIPLNLSAYSILVVHPGIHVDTAWAFSVLTPGLPVESARLIVQQPVDRWKLGLVNDFEAPVFARYPSLQGIKEKLYSAGALYASMSGSGSSIFGIFEKFAIPTLSFDPGIRFDIFN
jgi:4-diphosphocytidyl-2-C-methyl-D-erythritol kinase